MDKPLINSASQIVKSNVLVEALYNLELNEQRLLMLAIIHARETGRGITPDEPLFIPALLFADRFSMASGNAYKVLRSASDNLFTRQFSFITSVIPPDETEAVIALKRSRWVSEIGYMEEKQCVMIVLAPAVVSCIARLERYFTSYELDNVARFKSKYSIRLYETLVQWLAVKKTPPYLLTELRDRLGVEETEYPRVADFRAKVLAKAVKEINALSNLTVKVKEDKAYIGLDKTFTYEFSYFIKKGMSGEPLVPVEQIRLTGPQKNYFANLLLDHHAFCNEYANVNESRPDFKARLIELLDEPNAVRTFLPYLKAVGFNHK